MLGRLKTPEIFFNPYHGYQVLFLIGERPNIQTFPLKCSCLHLPDPWWPKFEAVVVVLSSHKAVPNFPIISLFTSHSGIFRLQNLMLGL